MSQNIHAQRAQDFGQRTASISGVFQVPKKALYPTSFYAPISVNDPLLASDHFGRPAVKTKAKAFDVRPGSVMDTFSGKYDFSLRDSSRPIRTDEQKKRKLTIKNAFNST